MHRALRASARPIVFAVSWRRRRQRYPDKPVQYIIPFSLRRASPDYRGAPAGAGVPRRSTSRR